MVDLLRVARSRILATVHALPAAVEIVEAVVLLVDHHDVVDAREAVVAAAVDVGARSSGADDRGQREDGRQGQQTATAESVQDLSHLLPFSPSVPRDAGT